MPDNIDSQNVIHVLDSFWKQCQEAIKLGNDIKIEGPVNRVIHCGMGGSAAPGNIISTYIGTKLPFVINKSYNLPLCADKNTLVFIVSYSGNTEEVLSCFRKAKAKRTKIIAISSGGKLEKMSKEGKVPHIKVPAGVQPRDAIGYLTLPLINVLQNSRIIEKHEHEFEDMIKILKKDYHEQAKEIAKKLVGKIPIIYASHRMAALAMIWKTKINEDAKVHAFFNEFSEMNHNEIVGYTDLKGDYFVIIIEDEDDHSRIKKRMKICSDLIKSKGVPVLTIKVRGSNTLSRIFSTLLLGSYMGYYLALEYGTDPAPVVIIENLKRQLGPFIG